MVLREICSYCRARKIRCDQAKPRCGQCVEAIYACTYDYGSYASRMAALPKGSACLNCRRDKKKCDGAKPKCSSCQKSPNGLECIYQPGKKRRKKSDLLQETHSSGTSCLENRVLSPTRISLSSSSGGCGSETFEITSPQAAQQIITIDVPLDPSLSFRDGTARSNFSTSGLSTNALIVPSACCKVAPQMRLDYGPEIAYATTQRAFEHSFGIFNMSGPVYTIDADSQAFALSNVSIHDRKMLFRMVFVSLRMMHGSYIPFAKLQAIIIGDLSGAFIQPFFIYFAELSGCHFYRRGRQDDSLLQHQGDLLQATYEALKRMRPEDDPLAYAEAQFHMSMAVMSVGNAKIAIGHLRKGVNTIRCFHIRFVPLGVDGNGDAVQEAGGYSEEAHERAVFLSKILHFETYLALYVMSLPGIQSFNADRDSAKVSHIPARKVQEIVEDLCDDLERQFRNDLPVAYPVLCEICPLILRAKTMVLTKDVRRHLVLVNQQVYGAGSWLPQTETLIIHLQQHLLIVLKLTDKFAETSEYDSTISLRSHSIITLTGLSELYRLLVRYPLSTPTVAKEAQRRCGDISKMIASITERMLKEDWKRMGNFVQGNYRDPTIATFAPSSESSMIMTLTSAGGLAGTSLLLPSKTFLENLEDLNNQARRSAEDEKLAGMPLEIIPKLFKTKVVEGGQLE